jgi:hypothetical protein
VKCFRLLWMFEIVASLGCRTVEIPEDAAKTDRQSAEWHEHLRQAVMIIQVTQTHHHHWWRKPGDCSLIDMATEGFQLICKIRCLVECCKQAGCLSNNKQRSAYPRDGAIRSNHPWLDDKNNRVTNLFEECFCSLFRILMQQILVDEYGESVKCALTIHSTTCQLNAPLTFLSLAHRSDTADSSDRVPCDCRTFDESRVV